MSTSVAIISVGTTLSIRIVTRNLNGISIARKSSRLNEGFFNFFVFKSIETRKKGKNKKA